MCDHQWVLDRIELAGHGIGQWLRCKTCGAEAYEPSAGDSPGRTTPPGDRGR